VTSPTVWLSECGTNRGEQMIDEYLSSFHEEVYKASHKARRNSIARRKVRDIARAAAAWTTESLIGSSRGTALSVVLATVGCSHARGDMGGCTMCSYLLDGTEKAPSDDELKMQFDNAMSKVAERPAPLSVKLYTSGSFLDSQEVSLGARNLILSSIANDSRVREVVVESRPEYVIDSTMTELRDTLGERRIEIGIGLESSNDTVRTLCVNKGFTLSDFNSAVDMARRSDIGIRAYVLLKPPFLTEKMALEDAKQTISYCGKIGVSTVSVNPVNVQKYTLVERLWQRGEYRPPWLWSLVELLRVSRESLNREVNIVCDPVAAGKKRGVHNCGKCDKEVASAIRNYSITQNPAVFSSLECDCMAQWEHAMDHEGVSLLVHSDL
jgi:radical SAM enzyme (TIGR01210 family)